MTQPKYNPHPERQSRLDSARAAIEAILPLKLYPAHKRDLLDVCLWKITEADGKMNVRYWSEGALSSPRSELRHEHVYERRELIQRLLKGEEIDSVISNAIACIVTKDEHSKLGKSGESGWRRYLAAGIRVFDTKVQDWCK